MLKKLFNLWICGLVMVFASQSEGSDAALFAQYQRDISPIIQNVCVNCHVRGDSAGSTRLVYTSGSSESIQRSNFDVLKPYIETNIKSGNADYVVLKGGGQGHGGGDQLNSSNERALRDFISAIEQALSAPPDGDEDGVADELDNCPQVRNDDQSDLDNDDSGDVCDEDIDGDGLTNDQEEILGTNSRNTDSDDDGVADDADNCPRLSNDDQGDLDNDDAGDACDEDIDGDGLSNEREQILGTDSRDSDSDDDGVADSEDLFPRDASETIDSDGDGVGDNSDAFPEDATEVADSDADGVGDRADAFDDDPFETRDTDGDGIGDGADPDDDNDGFSDAEERADGTNPLSSFSCRAGCYGFDIDRSGDVAPLTDGLIVIRHLFGFQGSALVQGAVAGTLAGWSAEDMGAYLQSGEADLDVDGDGGAQPLTDGLLVIRYLFGFREQSLIAGAIGSDATRVSAADIEAYLLDRLP